MSCAAWNGHPAVVKVLLNCRNTDPNLTNMSGRTPLLLAARNGRHEVVKLLLTARNFCQDDENRNPSISRLLGEAIEQGNGSASESFVQSSITNINERDLKHRTALSWAAENGHFTIAKLLLDAKANPNTEDHLGSTPLVLSAMNDKLEMVRLLLENNSEINGTNQVSRALYVAVLEGRAELEQFFVEKYAFEVQDFCGIDHMFSQYEN